MFEDDQALEAESESQLQKAALLLNNTMGKYNLKIATEK